MLRSSVPKVVFLTWFLALGASATSAAAREEAEASSDDGAKSECYPACRAGFVCHQGQCVSECNPPCPQGQACVDGQYCEVQPGAGAGAATYEPPPPGARGAGGVYEPPPPPPPPGFDRRKHSAIAFHMGLGGNLHEDGANRNLVSTLGANLRTDIPVAKYVLLGPLFQLGAWRPDVPNPPDRNFYVDIDFFARARIPIPQDDVDFQVWLGIPIGLTLDFLGKGYHDELESFAFGWNFGFLAGGAVHFSKKFGMFVEAGWMSHRIGHDRNSAGGSVDIEVAQTVLNFGFIFGN